MNRKDAEVIWRMVARMHNFAVGATRDTDSIDGIAADFMQAAVDEEPAPEFTWHVPEAPKPNGETWDYKFVPHPEAHIVGSRYFGRGYYWLFKRNTPGMFRARTNFEATARSICRAMTKHKQYETLLRQILDEVTATLDAPITRTNAPIGLDYRSLQYQIRELLK